MAETSAPVPSGLTRVEEEAAFYHEAALNTAWTGARLAMGGLSFLFGAFVFAFFYLRSLNSHHLWYPTTGSFQTHPKAWLGALIMALVVVSAAVQTGVLQRLKAGRKAPWQAGALLALGLGVVAIALQVYQLTDLGFWPGQSGFASVFVGYQPVFIAVTLGVLVWLETLIVRCRTIPEIAFVEQPPTYAEAFAVQRFQASLSAFTAVWNYMAVVAFLFWILLYLVH